MSELSYRAVERLLVHLERCGLMTRLRLSEEDIADSIWLALHMGVVETTKQEKQPEQQQPNQVIIEDSQTKEDKPISNTESPTKIYEEDLTTEKSETQERNKSLPFQTPAAPALQNKLPISRALRPLMRKVDSAIKTILDAEATVNYIVEQNIWLPITKAEPERWLNLELVVEESHSSFIWKETIDELQKLLQNHGAFRNVRVWNLWNKSDTTFESLNNRNLQLTRRKKGNQKSHSQHSYRELIRSDRRSLILFVSDCVSDIWKQLEIYQWLKNLSNKIPTAIIQLFPERLWQSSELGNGYKLQLSAFNPGVPNSDLVLPSLWEDLKREKIIKLPVITLEPFSLETWAKVIAGRGNSSTPGFVFDWEFLKKQINKEQQHQIELDKTLATVKDEELSPEYVAEIVDRFLATASSTAQRLAGFMAAVPVNLEVVNLIQKALLKDESTPVNVAEVFLSGMIQRIETSDDRQNPKYDFIPGARKLLNQATRLAETENVLDVLTSYIAENLGLSIKSFTAFLSSYQDFTQEQQKQILPFAEVTIEVLENLGGEYADFAKQIAVDINKTSETNEETEDEQTPKIRSSTFKIATIEFQEVSIFEFDVATLEQRNQIFGFGNPWVIKRQKKQTTGIIEILEGGIELELMEIPGGSFLMGSPEDERERSNTESPQHRVSISPFRMGKYPVTQEQWRTVANMQHLRVNRDLKPNSSNFKGDDRPVEQVSWYDAVEFCSRLSQYTGKQYRLPSEAEWEYACRAGTTTPFHFGETITSNLANYNGNYTYGALLKGEYRKQTRPVGSFGVANAFGLYDMHGNVWEWCLDDWHDNYKDAPTDGSAWFDGNNDNLYQKSGYVALRGGSWISIPKDCRSATRYDISLAVRDYKLNFIGFRVVCGVGRTS